MKKLYLSWRANLMESQTRVTRKYVVEWCCGCWDNPSVITSELIRETFLQAGITISLNKIENILYKE